MSTSFLKVTPRMTHQQLPSLHQETTIFMQKMAVLPLKWPFRIWNWIKALLKGDSDQCRLKLLRRSGGRSCMVDTITYPVWYNRTEKPICITLSQFLGLALSNWALIIHPSLSLGCMNLPLLWSICADSYGELYLGLLQTTLICFYNDSLWPACLSLTSL